MSSEPKLSKGYEPHDVERKWYQVWEARGYFRADEHSSKAPYAIVIPPPNVTGVLHMGHALNNTLQDTLCRWQRMQGKEVLWMPGTDHAGIATQNVVEKQLAVLGSDRHGSAATASSTGSGSGARNPAGRSSSSSSASAPPATGSASASPWTRGCRKRCARSSYASLKKG